MRQLKPRLIASISDSHLQNRLSDVHTRSPLPPHNFWRWSRCLGVTCSYQSQVVLITVMRLPVSSAGTHQSPEVRILDVPEPVSLCVGCVCGRGLDGGVSGGHRMGPGVPLELGLEGCWKLCAPTRFVLQIVAFWVEVRRCRSPSHTPPEAACGPSLTLTGPLT